MRRASRRCSPSAAAPGPTGWTRRFRLPKSMTGFTRRWAFIRTRRNACHRRAFRAPRRARAASEVIGWGEMGLDYHYDHSPRDVQQHVFRRQLAQARAAKLPIIIHCRDAWADCLEIIDQDWRSSGLGGIFHCFTGTLEDARRGLDMGFMISFAGNVTYPKMQHLRDVARELPLDRLLTETDSPFLPPQGRRGKRNEPAYVVEVAQALANVRNLAAEEIAATTAENFRRFFRLGRSASVPPSYGAE